MGLTCTLFRASSADIERLVHDPDAVAAYVESIEGGAPEMREVRPKGILGFLLRLTPIKISEPVPVDEREDVEPDPERYLDINANWHGLHFLLTGTAEGGEEPACYVVSGGENLDDEGYFRALRADQTRRFAEHLSKLTHAELERRYDPALMAKLEIYPDSIWTKPAPASESPLARLLECFAHVSSFTTKVAVAGDGVIIRIA
jgi:hypothetical protein